MRKSDDELLIVPATSPLEKAVKLAEQQMLRELDASYWGNAPEDRVRALRASILKTPDRSNAITGLAALLEDKP